MGDQDSQEKEVEQVSAEIIQDNSENHNEEMPDGEAQVDAAKLDRYMEKLRYEQNLPLALIAGFVSAIIGAILWASVTMATGYQIGYMAVAVGFLVGYAMRYAGKGMDPIFGISGAIFAILGCVLGNVFYILAAVAEILEVPVMGVLSEVNFSMIYELMAENFSPMDLLFYGIAVFEGYKFSFRKITEEEIIENATT